PRSLCRKAQQVRARTKNRGAMPLRTRIHIGQARHRNQPKRKIKVFLTRLNASEILCGTTYLNDTWSFDGTTWTQITTQPAPPARAAAQMTYDSVTQKVVLFGGFNGTYLSDTWLWDGSTLQWTQATPQHHPSAVTGPMLFPDPNGRADLFGGYDGHFYQLTMWQWAGSDWTQLFPQTVPFARADAAVATNTSTGQVVMFGGLADVN